MTIEPGVREEQAVTALVDELSTTLHCAMLFETEGTMPMAMNDIDGEYE